MSTVDVGGHAFHRSKWGIFILVALLPPPKRFNAMHLIMCTVLKDVFALQLRREGDRRSGRCSRMKFHRPKCKFECWLCSQLKAIEIFSENKIKNVPFGHINGKNTGQNDAKSIKMLICSGRISYYFRCA